ncbi:hypothetical protein [Myxococcus vastator]|uniref:hypothetical protein n=1 Tax=Myxococcus vastator TaxID=2709664 RepID=UPI0013D3646A|nr:hypothetical protein [Myxococcus vastator]
MTHPTPEQFFADVKARIAELKQKKEAAWAKVEEATAQGDEAQADREREAFASFNRQMLELALSQVSVGLELAVAHLGAQLPPKPPAH